MKLLSFDEKKRYINFFLVIIFFLSINRLDISIQIKTIAVILFGLIYYQYLPELRNLSFSQDYATLTLLFIFFIFTQNQFLNYETVSLDVPSYLVASQNVGLSELPLEKQWESKGPLFMYLYNLFSYFAQDHLVYFKLLNDILLFLVVIILFYTILSNTRKKPNSLIGSLIFVSLLSYVWYHSEFSEIYCLLFISFHFYYLNRNHLNTKTLFISSLLLSFSTLINQATFIFYISFLFLILRKKERFLNIKEIFYISIGSFFPHLIFIILYLQQGLINLYISNYLYLPLNYVGSDKFKSNELFVWLKRYFEFNELLYFSLILIFVFFIFKIFNNLYDILNEKIVFNILIYLTASFLIYVIAGHSYEHHLFYSIYFISLFASVFFNEKQINMIGLIVVIAAVQIFISSFSLSYNNLSNIDDVYNDYPLHQLSKEIDMIFDDEDYTVLAFDHVLLLYYLQKPNESYIIHPFNHYEDYIIEELKDLNLLETNGASHFSYYIELEPDVIICNSQAIIDGDPVALDSYNCEIHDYKKNYYKLDTSKYEDDKKREYFFDPYKIINVYVKNS